MGLPLIDLNPKSSSNLTLDPPQKGLIAGAGIVGLVLLVYLLATQSVAQPILLIIGLVIWLYLISCPLWLYFSV